MKSEIQIDFREWKNWHPFDPHGAIQMLNRLLEPHGVRIARTSDDISDFLELEAVSEDPERLQRVMIYYRTKAGAQRQTIHYPRIPRRGEFLSASEFPNNYLRVEFVQTFNRKEDATFNDAEIGVTFLSREDVPPELPGLVDAAVGVEVITREEINNLILSLPLSEDPR